MAKKAEKHKGFEAPGTFVLALLFLGWFILMFIVAWFSLGRLWPVR